MQHKTISVPLQRSTSAVVFPTVVRHSERRSDSFSLGALIEPI